MAKKTYIDLDNLTLYHNNLSAQLDKTDYVIAQALNDLNTRNQRIRRASYYFRGIIKDLSL